jgi:hypothetical protein
MHHFEQTFLTIPQNQMVIFMKQKAPHCSTLHQQTSGPKIEGVKANRIKVVKIIN